MNLSKFTFNYKILGGVTLNNIILLNNLFWYLYFENSIVELYVLNMHANFYTHVYIYIYIYIYEPIKFHFMIHVL